MRILLLLALLGAPGAARAGAWGLDVGLGGSMGITRFAGEPAGFRPVSDPSNLFSLFPPTVQSQGGTGLAGEALVELALHRKRRFMAALGLGWHGQSLGLEERFSFPSGTSLDRSTVWESSGFVLPLELSYGVPVWASERNAVMGRLGVGLWYLKYQAWSKRLASGGSSLAQPWNGPPDDWGPLWGLGFDWIRLPSGRRTVSLELRAQLGQAFPDPAAGADQRTWSMTCVVSVPVWMWVL